jgi:hypothetical protein
MPPLVCLTDPRDIRAIVTAPLTVLHSGNGAAITKPLFRAILFMLLEGEERIHRRELRSTWLHHHYLMAGSTGRYGKMESWQGASGCIRLDTQLGGACSTQLEQLLCHASIQTAGDIYTNWDIDKLAATMAEVLDDGGPTDREPNPKSFPLSSRKSLQMIGLYRQRDSNPCYRRERAAS